LEGNPIGETESLFDKGGFGFALGGSGLIHGFLVLNYAHKMTHFLSDCKGKRNSSHKSNKDTWHSLCSQRVARVGHPESGNSKNPIVLLQQGYSITTISPFFNNKRS
jgi:hypothetical protein